MIFETHHIIWLTVQPSRASTEAAEEAAKTTTATTNALGHWPRDVGIVAMEIYFPSLSVQQAELEAHDGVSAGKYTIGLGQQEMGFCGDREDVNSLCLTVVHKVNIFMSHLGVAIHASDYGHSFY